MLNSQATEARSIFEPSPLPSLADMPGAPSLNRKSKPAKTPAAFVLGEGNFDLIYGGEIAEEIAGLADILGPPHTRDSIMEHPEILAGAEIIFTGWGAPKFDQRFLDLAPNLKVVFHGSGSVRPFVSDTLWERQIRITSAAAANAEPVAEYVLGATLLSLKHFWKYSGETKLGLPWGTHTRTPPGGFRSRVGLVSFGTIARRVFQLLEPFDIQRMVYCPFLGFEEDRLPGGKLCSLEEIFQECDVVSLHTPHLPETTNLISGKLLASMKPGATLINTARGGILDHTDLLKVLGDRPDLTAILDVTAPEPPPADWPLLKLPNVIITPHLAGSQGPECRRMGSYMVEELRRYLSGRPLKWGITREMIDRMA